MNNVEDVKMDITKWLRRMEIQTVEELSSSATNCLDCGDNHFLERVWNSDLQKEVIVKYTITAEIVEI